MHDETESLHKFFNKHKQLFHQPCCPSQQQGHGDGPCDQTCQTKCFPKYFNDINVSVENCPLIDLIGYLVKTGKCNEEEKIWFETIMQTIEAETSWDDIEKITYLAEPLRYKNIVQLLISTLKTDVEEYKLLYRKRQKSKLLYSCSNLHDIQLKIAFKPFSLTYRVKLLQTLSFLSI